MNFGKLATAALSAGLIAGFAAAQEAAPVKIGFVEVERAVAQTDEGKARLKDLADWARPQEENLRKLRNDLNALQAERQSKRGAASEQSLAALDRQIIAKQREGEDIERAFKRELEQRQNAALKDLATNLQKVITDYSDGNRYTVVFILKPNEIAYLANSADITDEVVKLYNQKHPFQAKTGSAAPAGK